MAKTTRRSTAPPGRATAAKRPKAARVAAPAGEPEILPREVVAMRAYELFLMRGGSDGDDLGDWLAAERELALSRRA